MPKIDYSNDEFLKSVKCSKSSGFCFKCKIYVTDSVCFCAGGVCPKCGQYVAPGSVPNDLTRKYKTYSCKR